MSALAGAGAGLVTDAASRRPTLPWIAGFAVLVLLMAGSQIWLTLVDGRSPPDRRVRAGGVVVGGSSRAAIVTDVAGIRQVPGAPAGGQSVIGSGAVLVEKVSAGEIRTRVRDVEER
ncbi:hypothetical protein [Pseudofrankia inefficax]|uniref:hypothetical protein n=1 Tax=Pseudofrankia inefficax (strain DSM 45817 / CECT 9037 / DDB 130130 / EuI1c) TaxID=298654 RepID=UPI0012FDF3F0|nr:hypothetical protein [Pseudofrankia inefficax]